MRLAGGDEADPRLGQLVDGPIDRIGRGKGGCGIEFRLHPVLKVKAWRIRPADMQTVGIVPDRWADKLWQRVEIDRGTSLDQLGDGFHPHPEPGIAGQSEAKQAEGDQFGDCRRVQHRKRGADEAVFRLVRDRR